uniref:Putative phosphatidylglycerol/phosphatidylinositol transfer protein DDB_G0282179 n=1 Tax=Rhizophora mucronata TaxID=61149 RepID=A0A2P2JFX8_RHIMU
MCQSSHSNKVQQQGNAFQGQNLSNIAIITQLIFIKVQNFSPRFTLNIRASNASNFTSNK